MTRLPLPSSGSSGDEFPTFIGTIEKLRLLMLVGDAILIGRAALPRPASLAVSCRSSPRAFLDERTLLIEDLELCSAASPPRLITWKHQVSQVPRRTPV
jgi:hypothetical protein